MRISPQTKGYLMVFLSAVGFGSYGVWSRLIGAEFGVFFQGWVRSAIVLLFLVPIAFATKSFQRVEPSDRKWILTAVLFGAATQAPLYYAFNHMNIGTATLIFYSSYLITSYVIGKLFFGEKLTHIKLLSLILAFGGLVLVFGFSLIIFSLTALLLAAFNGIASGGEVAFTKKSTHKFSSLQIAMYVWLGILLTHLPISIAIGERQIPFAFNSVWFAMLAFAAAGLVAFWLVIEGYKYVDASIGGLIGLMEIIFGVVFGIIIFHEAVTLSVVLGGSLIILAAMLPNLADIRARR